MASGLQQGTEAGWWDPFLSLCSVCIPITFFLCPPLAALRTNTSLLVNWLWKWPCTLGDDVAVKPSSWPLHVTKVLSPVKKLVSIPFRRIQPEIQSFCEVGGGTRCLHITPPHTQPQPEASHILPSNQQWLISSSSGPAAATAVIPIHLCLLRQELLWKQSSHHQHRRWSLVQPVHGNQNWKHKPWPLIGTPRICSPHLSSMHDFDQTAGACVRMWGLQLSTADLVTRPIMIINVKLDRVRKIEINR